MGKTIYTGHIRTYRNFCFVPVSTRVWRQHYLASCFLCILTQDLFPKWRIYGYRSF